MRYRFILPLANIVLGVLLFHLGDLQVRRIQEKYGAYEGTQDAAATARYVHYALNAPVWALLEERDIYLWSPSTYWTGHDLHYFFGATVMWFLIGLKLDRRFSRTGAEHVPEKTRWKRILAWAFVVYGLFVCYSFLPQPYYGPLRDYFALLIKSLSYAWWWYLLGMGWGIGLVTFGLCSVFCSRRSVLA